MRDAAITAEEDVSVQAVERGQELANTVAYLRGAVTTFDAAEKFLDTAVERTNTTEATVAELAAEHDKAMWGRTMAELERTTHGNRAQQANLAIVTARYTATLSDTRRIGADTATQTVRQNLAQARAERETAMTRRDELEEEVAELTRERDMAVEESAGVQAIRDCLEEAHEDVERLTTNVNEL